MADPQVRQTLERLLELLGQERDAAQRLDMDALQMVVADKEELLKGLVIARDQVDGLQDLLKEIDQENRRNAFLLWTGLNWVRDLMGFFGKAAMPQVYGGSGQSRTLHQGGRLLSGKV
jgi:flagellar biosynthesis/type III secretory pathway chaperone